MSEKETQECCGNCSCNQSEDAPTQAQPPKNLPLAAAITGLERELSAAGWDRPPQLFILVPTQELLAQTPDLPESLRDELNSVIAEVPDHLTPILQDDLPDIPLTDIIGHIVFPSEVQGVAVSMERIVLPPEVEEQAPADEDARVEFFMKHPQRDDVRMVVGTMRNGDSWCALRVRSQDNPNLVATGENLVPELVEALQGTLEDVDEKELLDPEEAFPEFYVESENDEDAASESEEKNV